PNPRTGSDHLHLGTAFQLLRRTLSPLDGRSGGSDGTCRYCKPGGDCLRPSYRGIQWHLRRGAREMERVWPGKGALRHPPSLRRVSGVLKRPGYDGLWSCRSFFSAWKTATIERLTPPPFIPGSDIFTSLVQAQGARASA